MDEKENVLIFGVQTLILYFTEDILTCHNSLPGLLSLVLTTASEPCLPKLLPKTFLKGNSLYSMLLLKPQVGKSAPTFKAINLSIHQSILSPYAK